MNLNGDAIQTSATRISQARDVLTGLCAAIGGYGREQEMPRNKSRYQMQQQILQAEGLGRECQCFVPNALEFEVSRQCVVLGPPAQNVRQHEMLCHSFWPRRSLDQPSRNKFKN